MTECDVDPTFYLKKDSVKTITEKYKEYRRRWNEDPKKFISNNYPIHVDLETNSHCNLKCYMCFQTFDPPEKKIMDLDLAKKIIDEGTQKGLCSIKTQYRGEPLLYKDLPELIKYAKDKGIIEIMFNTNATLLTANLANKLIDAGLDKIICSVDGYQKDVYENIRILGNFDIVLKNIIGIQKIKKAKAVIKPTVRVQMVDTPRNHHQIEGYLKFWSDIVEQVAIQDMLNWDSKEEDATYLENWACAQLWQRLFVLADGDVLPCCRAIQGGTSKLEVLGSAFNESLENLWKGKRMTELRTLHKLGQSHKIKMCRICSIRKAIIKKRKEE